jgi:hypothetical protein
LRLGFSDEIGTEELEGPAAVLHHTISIIDESSGSYLIKVGGAACQENPNGTDAHNPTSSL